MITFSFLCWKHHGIFLQLTQLESGRNFESKTFENVGIPRRLFLQAFLVSQTCQYLIYSHQSISVEYSHPVLAPVIFPSSGKSQLLSSACVFSLQGRYLPYDFSSLTFSETLLILRFSAFVLFVRIIVMALHVGSEATHQ